MKILVYVPNGQGGVRNVTLGLADGFERLDHKVVIVETMPECAKYVFDKTIDLAVLSLGSGFFAPFFRQSIYILHGFAAVDSHTFTVRFLLGAVPRLVRFFGGKLIAVSHLTRAVHERILGIPVDGVVFNGVSQDFFDSTNSDKKINKKKNFIFVGRFIDEKKVVEISHAFVRSGVHSLGYRMQFVGVGPLEGLLQRIASENNGIEIHVDVDEQRKVQMMREASIFVSLNNFEPMGVVFAEALVCGCKIIAPMCGGHREFIPTDYPLVTCDPLNASSVEQAFKAAIHLETRFNPLVQWEQFSYREYIASAYLKYIIDDSSKTI